MTRRASRLVAVLAAGLLALLAVSAAGRTGIRLPAVDSSVTSDLATPRLSTGVSPTREKPEAAKHGRTAPLLPAAALVAAVALALYGFSIAGAPAVIGRLARPGISSRGPRAPPAGLSI